MRGVGLRDEEAVGSGEMTAIMLAVGNALGDALGRPGRVVVHLVLGQDGAQVALAEDQHAIEELPTQGADEALADCGPWAPAAGWSGS